MPIAARTSASAANAAGEQREEPRLLDRVRDDVAERGDAGDGDGAVDRRHGLTQRRGQQGRVARRAQHDVHPGLGELPVGDERSRRGSIRARPCVLTSAAMPTTVNHGLSLPPNRTRLPSGIFAREVGTGERFVDDDRRRRRLCPRSCGRAAIGMPMVSKYSALTSRYHVAGVWLGEAAGARPSIGKRHVAVAAERQHRGERGAAHARQRPRAFQHLVVERPMLGRRVVAAGARRVDEPDQHVRGIEAEVRRAQVHERLQQQPAAGEQHQRQRDFRRDQRAPEPASGRHDVAACRILERLHDVAARRVERRHQAEQHAGRDAEQCDEEEDGDIEPHFGDARRARRSDRDQAVDGPPRPATRPAAPPSSASSRLSVSSWRTRRPLPAPSATRTASSRPRLEALAITRLAMFAQAISSTNADRPEQREQTAFDVPDDAVVEADQVDAGLFVEVGMLRLQPAREHVGRRLRAVDRQSGGQARHRCGARPSLATASPC